MAKQEFHYEFGGRGITVETGEIAKQADGAVVIRYGDTVTLSTACASNTPKEGIDFFPLTVSFEEKLYSVGKIPGGFLRREGRPSEHATLSARMIDRPIRPLFAEGFRNEVQVVNTILSVDQDAPAEMAAMLARRWRFAFRTFRLTDRSRVSKSAAWMASSSSIQARSRRKKVTST